MMAGKQMGTETTPTPNLISTCPYCGIACSLDNQAKELLFDPDGVGGKPCEHCTFVSVCLDAQSAQGRDLERSCWLLWGYGEGLRRIDFAGPRDLLDEYIEQLALDSRYGLDAWRAASGRAADRSRFVFLPAEKWPRGVEFKVSGGTATPADRRGKALHAVLDGWGVYSPEPARMAKLVRHLVGDSGVGRAGSDLR